VLLYPGATKGEVTSHQWTHKSVGNFLPELLHLSCVYGAACGGLVAVTTHLGCKAAHSRASNGPIYVLWKPSCRNTWEGEVGI